MNNAIYNEYTVDELQASFGYVSLNVNIDNIQPHTIVLFINMLPYVDILIKATFIVFTAKLASVTKWAVSETSISSRNVSGS